MAPQSSGHGQPLEILESGTGHGSLTLHLARAIQAANNIRPPQLPHKSQVRFLQGRPTRPDEQEEGKQKPKQDGKYIGGGGEDEERIQQQWDAWRGQRNAIIHTVDISSKFSIHAEKIVRGFRRGIYAGSVDFYVGNVENWIAEQTNLRTSAGMTEEGKETLEPFLSYAVLDMPSAHIHIPRVVPLLRRDGVLIVFMPSITQIGDCMALIRDQRLPFISDKVVELGSGISSGRLWDVRFAVKKSRADPSSWSSAPAAKPSSSQALPDEEPSSAAEDSFVGDSSGQRASDEPPSSSSSDVGASTISDQKIEESVLVCRPKVGTRIVGGGFVGLWRRIEDRTASCQRN